MEQTEFETLTIDASGVDIRLDKLLATHYPHLSRTYFQYLIENGAVLINEKVVKKREKLKVGDEVEICFLYTPELSVAPENIPLEILYEDESIIAINKPAGMVVHPAAGHPSGTFVNALLYHCKLESEEGSTRPGIVHRLDKETSGILIAAKTRAAHQGLIELFSGRKIVKKYLAIVIGKPPQGRIDLPIGRHKIKRKEMCVAEDGKMASSEIKLLGSARGLSLLEVEIFTGRTHQIRVHMKALHTPILGDTIYGNSAHNKKFIAKRQLLHAFSLSFNHPITGKKIDLTAPPPEDFVHFQKIILEE